MNHSPHKMTGAKLRRQLQQERDILETVLGDVVRKEVTWNARGNRFRLGISRLTGAAGGYAVLVVRGENGQRDTVCAYLLEDFIHKNKETHGSTDPIVVAISELAIWAQEMQTRAFALARTHALPADSGKTTGLRS